MWKNLSDFGFDNVTSSYQTFGSCHSLFKDGANGSGAAYPNNPQDPPEAVNNMASGWDNKVSSIFVGSGV